MKIRLRRNSIRLRLTKTEVESLSIKGSFSEKTTFPNNTLTYTIYAKEDLEFMHASFKENTISISIPKKDCLDWPTNTKIGFQNTIKIGKDSDLSILVEKDFVCMDETVEDQSNNYPNPKTI